MSTYQYKDKKLPSVTTIISDCTDKSGALTHWAAGCACDYILAHYEPDTGIEQVVKKARKEFRNVSNKARDIGSQAHSAIEHDLLTGKEPTNPPEEVLSAFVAFLEWKDEYQVEPIKTEYTVYSEKWAGTADLVCSIMIDGEKKKYLIDFKTSKAIYVEYRYQVAAYRSETDCDGCGILRIDKITGLPEFKDTTKTYADDLNVFNKMVELYYARHPRIRKNAGF